MELTHPVATVAPSDLESADSTSKPLLAENAPASDAPVDEEQVSLVSALKARILDLLAPLIQVARGLKEAIVKWLDAHPTVKKVLSTLGDMISVVLLFADLVSDVVISADLFRAEQWTFGGITSFLIVGWRLSCLRELR